LNRKNTTIQKDLTCIDLFAGAGGFSLAAKKAGFKVLSAIEYDKWAQETYKQNFIVGQKHPPLLYGDIWDIDPKQIFQDIDLIARASSKRSN